MGLDSLTPLIYLASRWAGTLSQALNSRTLAKAGGVTGQESGQWSGWWPRWEEAPWWIRGWFIQTEARRQDVELEKDPGLMISLESTGPSHHQSGPRRHQPTPFSLSSYMCWCLLFSLACTGPVTWSTLMNRLPRWQWSKIYLSMQEMPEMQVRPLGWEDPLEEEVATHSRILAWGIQWTEEPGRLWSMRLRRVGHGWGTELTHTHTHTHPD